MRLSHGVCIPVIITALCLPAVGAGQQKVEGDQRVQPSAPVSPEMTAQVPEESQPAPPAPDARSFLGAEEFTAGLPGRQRSYIFPSFQFSEMYDSNFALGTRHQKFETINTLVGRLSLQKVGRRSKTSADYLGGGLIYNHHSELNSTIHALGITQSYQGRRWGFLLDDRATYLPESTYGYGGFGWMGALGSDIGGAFGSNLTSLNPVFSPIGSLVTGRGLRIMNTAVAQVQYLAGPRSAITLGGSYSLLHFREPGFIGASNAFFHAGYSRSLTARDYFGVNYGFGLFRFQHVGQSFQVNFLQLSYGHRISGRMAMEVAAGPQVNVFKNPYVGSTTPVSWTAHSSLDYRFRRGNLGLSYSRYTTSGGGLLTGANTDQVQLSWGLELTRKWSGSLGPGYAQSRSLPQTTAAKTESTYDSIYAGASLSRRLGRYTSMFFTYNLQSQRSQTAPCLAGSCRTSQLRHLLGFGFDWHPRQMAID